MGWDADAVVERTRRKFRVKDKALRFRFKSAAAEVQRLSATSTADGYLVDGGLDCSLCGEMLEKATGLSVYTPDGWDAREVSTSATWEFTPAPEEEWAYLSAKYFLDICAEYGLRIRFTW